MGIRRKRFKVASLTLLVLALGMFGFSSNTYASDDRFELIKTVFHVYVDGEEIGIVNEKRVAESTKQEVIEQAKDRFKDIQLTVNENIEYVPERIFNPDIDHAAVKEKLKDRLTVGIMGAEVSFGGKTLGTFKTQEEAQAFLRELKLQHTDAETLDRLKEEAENNTEAAASTTEPEEAAEKDLKDQVTSVSFDQQVRIQDTKVAIDDVMDMKEALALYKKGTLEQQVYEVKEDDTLKSIAKEYDLKVKKLYELNPSLNQGDKIEEGQKLYVLDYVPFAHVVVKERVTKEHTIEHESEVKEDDSMPKGESEVEQEGKDGKKKVQYAVTKVNGKVTEEQVLSEEVLSKPVTEITIKGTKIIPSRGTGSFHWPTVGGYISSKKGQRWGRAHKGIDIARPSSRSILAVDNGTVVSAGYNNGGYGNRIIINHNNGFKSVYAHLASMNVSVGQTVKKGQKIGVMGSTGNSTGIHLHFELYKNGALLNPLSYISR